jgi:hypothetical protein
MLSTLTIIMIILADNAQKIEIIISLFYVLKIK